LVLTAFIGPGTVTVYTIAGAIHGYDLLWALLLMVVATLIIQEMTARLGFATRKGLGDSTIRQHSTKGLIRFFLHSLPSPLSGLAMPHMKPEIVQELYWDWNWPPAVGGAGLLSLVE